MTREGAAAFVRGVRFFRHPETDETMFVHVLDGRSSIGPRPATQEDVEAHPEAYASMGELPDSPLGPRVVTVAEADPEPEAKPHAAMRQAAHERGETG